MHYYKSSISHEEACKKYSIACEVNNSNLEFLIKKYNKSIWKITENLLKENIHFMFNYSCADNSNALEGKKLFINAWPKIFIYAKENNMNDLSEYLYKMQDKFFNCFNILVKTSTDNINKNNISNTNNQNNNNNTINNNYCSNNINNNAINNKQYEKDMNSKMMNNNKYNNNIDNNIMYNNQYNNNINSNMIYINRNNDYTNYLEMNRFSMINKGNIK